MSLTSWPPGPLQLPRSIRYGYLQHQSNTAGLWKQQTVHTQEHGTMVQGRGDRKSDICFPLDLPATLRRRSETAPRGITQSHTDI